jgi:glycosyltransferase involved in cell wall biosynthesis
MATALSYRDVSPQRIVGSHFGPFRKEEGISTDFLVVIPTFRRREYLKQTLDSVLTQPDVTAMVIVIDDSPEHSAESIVEGYADQPVIYLANPKPSGANPGMVRDLGMSYARAHRIQGDFVHFLDDDDIVPEGLYPAVKKAFPAHPNIGVVFGLVEPFGDPSKERQFGPGAEIFRRRGAPCAGLPLDCEKLADQGPKACARAILANDTDDVWPSFAYLQLCVRNASLFRRGLWIRSGHSAWRGRRVLRPRHTALRRVVSRPTNLAVSYQRQLFDAYHRHECHCEG